jgi:hypothetical protein
VNLRDLAGTELVARWIGEWGETQTEFSSHLYEMCAVLCWEHNGYQLREILEIHLTSFGIFVISGQQKRSTYHTGWGIGVGPFGVSGYHTTHHDFLGWSSFHIRKLNIGHYFGMITFGWTDYGSNWQVWRRIQREA